MKTRNKFGSRPEKHAEHLKHPQEDIEAADFHDKRVNSEEALETSRVSLNLPVGNDEYEQLIAEDASLNARRMIEEAAFYLAERRGFAPGEELSDWLRAEAEVENTLRSSRVVPRRNEMIEDRRETFRPLQ